VSNQVLRFSTKASLFVKNLNCVIKEYIACDFCTIYSMSCSITSGHVMIFSKHHNFCNKIIIELAFLLRLTKVLSLFFLTECSE
jgi:hypothetical protein